MPLSDDEMDEFVEEFLAEPRPVNDSPQADLSEAELDAIMSGMAEDEADARRATRMIPPTFPRGAWRPRPRPPAPSPTRETVDFRFPGEIRTRHFEPKPKDPLQLILEGITGGKGKPVPPLKTGTIWKHKSLDREATYRKGSPEDLRVLITQSKRALVVRPLSGTVKGTYKVDPDLFLEHFEPIEVEHKPTFWQVLGSLFEDD